MSVDRILRDMVREEVERLLGPMQEGLAAQTAIVERLAAAFGAPVKRGPGRPPKLLALPKRVGRAAKPGRRAAGEAGRGCALEDCKNPSRSKGYCAAHYQKFRNLAKTGRLPADWVEDAAPGSVKNVVLPRGRAGAKALAEARKK